MAWSTAQGVERRLCRLMMGLMLCVLGLFLQSNYVLGATLLLYPHKESTTDTRYDYDWAVLRAALEKTVPQFGPFEMRPSDDVMTQARVSNEMQEATGRVNVFARSTSIDLEQRFIPVRIPIDRGMLGYRLLLIRSNDLPRFSQVRELDDLRKFPIGLGKGWSDVAILKSAGLNVVEGNSYEGLFSMLSLGRFDAFSRSIDEAYREYDERRDSHPDITVEPTLLVYYPLPRYFFFQHGEEGEQLAKRIETGMEMMVRDGSLQALLHKFKDVEIKRASLETRRLIRVPNPLLPPKTPLERHELWYDPLEKIPATKAK